MKFCYCFDHQDGCNPRINSQKGDYGRQDCCCCSDFSLKCHRLVKKIQISRGDGKKKQGRFPNFCFPNACKIELRVFREGSAFIREDSEMCRLPAYLDNPVSQLIFLLVVDLNFNLANSLDGAHCTVCLYAFDMMQAFIEIIRIILNF